MLELLTILLDVDVKAWFENPAYLIGVPLLALGALGVLLALAPVELRWPEPGPPEEEYEIFDQPEGHPGAAEYIKVGLILALITAVEVAVYYVDILESSLLAILLVLSAGKFILVVLWFMHLRFDNKLLSITFASGMLLVALLFVVVLATLGASLV